MSAQKWKLENIEKDMCRCCHTEGSHESLYTSLNWMGTEEVVYADMLQDCYDIKLTPVQLPTKKQVCTICESCIEKLHHALQFKRQVQTCEIRLREMILKLSKGPDYLVEVKQELPDREDNNHDAKPIVDCYNIQVKVDRDYRADEETMACDDTALSDYENDAEFKMEDPDGFHNDSSVRRSGRKKLNSQLVVAQTQLGKKGKLATSKVKKKKVSKKSSKRLKEEKELDDTNEGVVKVVKRVQIQEDIDYKQIGDLVQCCRCEKTNKCKQYIRKHIRHVHLNVPKHSCSYCQRTFLNVVPFTQHKLDVHNIDDRVKCTACDKVFNSKSQLKKHVDCFHMVGVKYKCTECDYVCFNSQYMRKHKLKHKTVKEYQCKYCRKSFMRRNTLNFHERIHTGDKRKVCKECGEAFVQKASLNYHMAKYHPGVDF